MTSLHFLLWRHSRTMTSPIRYYDVTFLLWRHYPSTLKSLFCYDVTTLYYGVTILLWRHSFTITTLPFYYYVTLLLWRYYPSTMTSLFFYDVTPPLLWRHYSIITSLFFYDVTPLRFCVPLPGDSPKEPSTRVVVGMELALEKPVGTVYASKFAPPKTLSVERL